jgi:hypothetical protein
MAKRSTVLLVLFSLSAFFFGLLLGWFIPIKAVNAAIDHPRKVVQSWINVTARRLVLMRVMDTKIQSSKTAFVNKYNTSGAGTWNEYLSGTRMTQAQMSACNSWIASFNTLVNNATADWIVANVNDSDPDNRALD